jgi:hypothetical protein
MYIFFYTVWHANLLSCTWRSSNFWNLGTFNYPIALYMFCNLANFCVSFHTVNWYLKIPNDCGSVCNNFKLLFGKHIGSIIGGAFVNGFFFLIQAILDLIRSCRNSKIKSNQCFFNAIDLARSDAASLIILAGNPYCNSSKYCEYLWS